MSSSVGWFWKIEQKDAKSTHLLRGSRPSVNLLHYTPIKEWLNQLNPTFFLHHLIVRSLHERAPALQSRRIFFINLELILQTEQKTQPALENIFLQDGDCPEKLFLVPQSMSIVVVQPGHPTPRVSCRRGTGVPRASVPPSPRAGGGGVFEGDSGLFGYHITLAALGERNQGGVVGVLDLEDLLDQKPKVLVLDFAADVEAEKAAEVEQREVEVVPEGEEELHLLLELLEQLVGGGVALEHVGVSPEVRVLLQDLGLEVRELLPNGRVGAQLHVLREVHVCINPTDEPQVLLDGVVHRLDDVLLQGGQPRDHVVQEQVDLDAPRVQPVQVAEDALQVVLRLVDPYLVLAGEPVFQEEPQDHLLVQVPLPLQTAELLIHHLQDVHQVHALGAPM